MVNNYREGKPMKFATVIREAGFSTEEFENCSKLPIILYDRKDRVTSEKDIHFSEKLFQKNPIAYEQFHAFLTKLEKTLIFGNVNIKIDEASVIIFYKMPSLRPRVFLRKPNDPLDYMG